jgi:hypothetical protein
MCGGGQQDSAAKARYITSRAVAILYRFVYTDPKKYMRFEDCYWDIRISGNQGVGYQESGYQVGYATERRP